VGAPDAAGGAAGPLAAARGSLELAPAPAELDATRVSWDAGSGACWEVHPSALKNTPQIPIRTADMTPAITLTDTLEGLQKCLGLDEIVATVHGRRRKRRGSYRITMATSALPLL